MSDPSLSTFGARVRHLRALVPGLEQAELNRLAGLHRGQVWQIEEGHRENPTRESVAGLRRVLGASADWLLFGEGTAPSARRVRAAVEAARAAAPADGMPADESSSPIAEAS